MDVEKECREGENNETPDFVVNEDGSITIDDITIPPAPIPALTYEAEKERLIITELAVTNFKSYAGNHIIGLFNKNFSCIVGPNGSGKSNVIDALLFVFGYRAQKIRSKKVSVLIHKSHKFPDLTSCSVTVRFATIKDEGDNFVILPDSQFSVSRTGYLDNSSTYEINGRRSQYKDVAALLKRYGIDLDYNRFMILQGEIELISMMKPKSVGDQEAGMLEYIEDIIGCNRFIHSIQHFSGKAEEVNELRLEKLNQLKVIEKEREDAEGPRNKAMEYLRLANKVTFMENAVLQACIKDTAEDDNKLTEEKEVLSSKIEDLSKSVISLENEKKLKEMELRDITGAHNDQANQVENLKKEFTALERQDVACRENIKNNKEKTKKLTKVIDEEDKKIVNLKQQPDVLKGEIDELQQKKDKLEKTKKIEEEKLAQAMGSMKDEIKDYQDEKDTLEKELVHLKENTNEKKSELDLKQFEFDLILSSEKKEKEVLETLVKDYEQALTAIKDEEKCLKNGSEKLPHLNSQLHSAKQQLPGVEKKEADLSEQIKIKRNKLDEMKTSLNSSESRNILVKSFMEQKRKGKFTGVYGRLGDLGSIDAKYDVAISTACGALDHIVTDTMGTAQECVQFLKANNLGYATFVALDQLKKWEPYTTRKIPTPENVPRLFDLVRVKDSSVLTAFYFALQNTLVANDLDQATRVGLQGSSRYRVVSLNGEIVDLSGTMSGGGGRSFKGRMGQSVASDIGVSQKETDQLSGEVEKLVKELAEVKDMKSKLYESIEQWEKEATDLHHSVRKSESSLNGHTQRKEMLEKQVEEQKQKVKTCAPDRVKIAELEAQIKKLDKNYSKAFEDTSIVENKVKGLQEKILSITKGKYGAAQKKVDKLEDEIKKVSNNITKSNGMLKNTSKNLEKAESKIVSLKEELEVCKNSMESLKAEFKDIEDKGDDATKRKKEAEGVLLALQVQKALVTGEVKEFSTKMHEIKSEITEMKNKSKMLDIDARANHGKLRGLKEKLSKLEIHDIGEGPTTLATLTEEDIAEVAVSSMEVEIGKIRSQIKNMNPDLGAIAEFKRKEELYRTKLQDLETTSQKRDFYRKHHENLRKQRHQEFMRGFSIITLKVKELYQMMTMGGDAELELVDSLDPFSEGIEYSVRPFRKSWKSIRNLSGGEKTLSSLALVFALHFYRSTPFFVMDEIDAALDFRNVSIIGSYIKSCTKNAQFIVISLRENMFLLADNLIGIYKTNNRTKNVFINPPRLLQTNISVNQDTLESTVKDSVFESLKENTNASLESLPVPPAIPEVSMIALSRNSSKTPLGSQKSNQEVPRTTRASLGQKNVIDENDQSAEQTTSRVSSGQKSNQNIMDDNDQGTAKSTSRVSSGQINDDDSDQDFVKTPARGPRKDNAKRGQKSAKKVIIEDDSDVKTPPKSSQKNMRGEKGTKRKVRIDEDSNNVFRISSSAVEDPVMGKENRGSAKKSVAKTNKRKADMPSAIVFSDDDDFVISKAGHKDGHSEDTD